MYEIKQLTDREHILKRPAMYIGAVQSIKQHEYTLNNKGKIEYSEVTYVPGLIKIINEIIDNSVDVAIKSGFTKSANIHVCIDKTSVRVRDDGTGIPVKTNADGKYFPEICWGCAKTGSNFDDENRTQIGMNGIGSFASNVFSTKFVGISDDGVEKCVCTFENNASNVQVKIAKSSGVSGVDVKFFPELSLFGLTEIDETHQNIVKQRLINLGMSFPQISFKFNNRKVNTQSFKRYVGMFSEKSEIFETDDFQFAVVPNETDDFKQFSYVNGLKIPDGGTHVEVIAGNVVRGIREKLKRKYKTIKPGDIKNKMMLIVFMKNFSNPEFNSQAKEKITNSTKVVNEYFGEIPYEKIVQKLLRTPEFIDSITEIYRIKEEFKRRQELKTLNGRKKRVKSEKYYPSIGVKKYLVLTEGESACGTLIPTLGRKECGYYSLKGVPLNAFSASQDKFTKNKELSELYTIVKNEGYQYIVIGADADCDGNHIIGLLFGFFKRYFPEWTNGKINILKTPVISVTKKGKLTNWCYNVTDQLTLKPGETTHYKKGLGSWDSDQLKQVVQTDGLNNIIVNMEFDSDEILQDWLGDSSEPRKVHIQNNTFDITSA